MVNKIKRYLENICHLTSGDAIVAGVSGGADSVCLLCVLREIYAGSGVALHVVHINHNLRAEAAEDQKYVEELCSQWKIPCHCYSYDVKGTAAKQGLSEEEAGRQLRYKAFYELKEQLAADARGGQVRIAVAHTMDDNAETMLFNLFRGTGIRGLCGIPVSRGDIIRPLLCVRRDEIEAWLGARGIGWRNDCTNDTDDYTRNKIRHKILSVAEGEINDNAVEHMNHTAEQLTLAKDYLEEKTMQAFHDCVRPLAGIAAAGDYDSAGAPLRREDSEDFDDTDAPLWREDSEDYDSMGAPSWRAKESGLRILGEPLAAVHPYLKKSVLLRAMQETAGTAKDIGSVHVEALEGLFELQCGKQLCLSYGLRAERTYDGVILRRKTAVEKDGSECRKGVSEETVNAVDLKICGTTQIPGYGTFETRILQREKQNFCEFPKDRYTKWFDYDKIKNTVCLRTRRERDYLVIDSEGNTQKLKSYLINQKIPGREREKLLLAADGNHIMWIVGYRSSFGYYVSETTKNILEVRFIRK